MAFFDKLREKLSEVRKKWSQSLSSLFGRGVFDEDFWTELEEVLIAGDTGVELSEDLVSELKSVQRSQNIKEPQLLQDKFVDILSDKLSSVPLMGQGLKLERGLTVVLMVGVNGSGKTTTTGKLATMYKGMGKKVILAACDTFRAAAIEQLKVWGERADVRVIAQKQGSDSASVAFDAISAAKASGTDVLIIDTAGRLQSKHNLMEELGKIDRIVAREVGRDHMESILVIDAVMGQNAFRQAEAFNEVVPLTGVVLAKYDNTSKGGIVLSIADKLKLPIRYVGLGEKVTDLETFNPKEFVQALLS